METPTLFDTHNGLAGQSFPMHSPPVARKHDPQTSWDAAHSVHGVRENQQQVLTILEEHGPCTDEAIAGYASVTFIKKQSPSGYRTRRKELVTLGLVRDSGTTRLMSTNRKGTVWGLAKP